MEFKNVFEKYDSDALAEYAHAAWEENKSVPGDYDDDFDMFYDDVLSGAVMVAEIADTAFAERVSDYLATKGKTLESAVRGYVKLQRGFAMIHGYGYDWISSDLLGGKADGEAHKDFDRFLEARGDYWYGN